MGSFAAMGRIVSQSYRDALALLQRMTLPLAIALIVVVAANVVGLLVEQRLSTSIARIVTATLASVAGTWVAAPYLLVLYRFVLLGETNLKPEMLRNSEASNRLFAWSAVVAFLWMAPAVVLAVLTPPNMTIEQATRPEYAPAIWLTFALVLGFWIFTTRALTLLPGAALGVATSIPQAFAETRGRFWFIVGTVFVAVFPISLAITLLQAISAGIIAMAVSVLTMIVALTIGITLTANLYKWLLDNPK